MHNKDKSNISLLQAITATEQLIRSNIDLIPVNNWGFSDEILEKLKQRKHKLVNEHLSKEERKKLSNAHKQKLARQMHGECRRISDVIDWMNNKNLNTKPNKIKLKREKSDDASVNADATSNEPQSNSYKPSSAKRMKLDIDDKEHPAAVSSSDRPLSKKSAHSDNESSDNSDNDNSSSDTNGKDISDTNGKQKPDSASAKNISKKPSEPKIKNSKKGSPNNGECNDLTIMDPLEGRRIALKKLQQRINQLRCLRKGKKSAQDYEEQRKLKRRMSVIKRKEKQKVLKEATKTDKSESTSNASNGMKTENGVLSSKNPAQPVNDNGQLVYSKFDFIIKDNPKKETKKDKRDKFVGKDYGRLLKKVEKRDQRIASIREKNPEKAEKIEENIKWKNAMSRIEGVKVKDNAQLLKRGMKRKEKIHEQRKHKWDKRLETVADKQSKRQEKRDTNLQARRDVVKKKKLDKARKKGRIIS